MGEIGGPEGERGNKEAFANFLRRILQEKDVEATCTGNELGTWEAGRVCNLPPPLHIFTSGGALVLVMRF